MTAAAFKIAKEHFKARIEKAISKEVPPELLKIPPKIEVQKPDLIIKKVEPPLNVEKKAPVKKTKK